MIVYNELWKTMKDKGFTKYRLIHKHGIAQATISRMVKNKPTSSTTIDDLCRILDCRVEDVMTFVDDGDGEDEKSEGSSVENL